ncbi:MAG: dipeptide/tripeptide permease [Francisella sp.]|jgi:dipeptide/tripeptide permease
MWEIFGYAIISTTIIFILIQWFDLSDNRSNIIVGSFTATLYITSVLAGQIADKIIGYYRSVLLGGIFLIIGYTYLALAPDLFAFCIALGVVCSGTGLLKTNVGSYLGYSYKVGDTHRQIGFIKLNLEIYKKEINLKRWLLAIIISIAGTAISVLVIYIPSISNIFLVLVIILVCM